MKRMGDFANERSMNPSHSQANEVLRHGLGGSVVPRHPIHPIPGWGEHVGRRVDALSPDPRGVPWEPPGDSILCSQQVRLASIVHQMALPGHSSGLRLRCPVLLLLPRRPALPPGHSPIPSLETLFLLHQWNLHILMLVKVKCDCQSNTKTLGTILFIYSF